MPHHLHRCTLALAAAVIGLTSCTIAPPPADQLAAVRLASETQPLTIAGKVEYSNDIFLTYHSRHAVALVDLHGFVVRDANWRIPEPSLQYGLMEVDSERGTASYSVHLPLHPAGRLHDVDHDGSKDAGVKIFNVAYWSDPFNEYSSTMRGWPTYLASTKSDHERNDEIIGGKLIVWAPDKEQQFPSGFGPDGKLFTDDDLLQPIPAGYAVVDLDAEPFAIDQSLEPKVALHEGKDMAIKDFSDRSYTTAFEQMFSQVRRDYAFSGIPGKEPMWDELFKQLRPRIVKAEQAEDPRAFFLALRDFVFAFHDGHTVIDGGDIEDAFYDSADSGITGGYGFALRELDDGRTMVVYVQEDGPAEKAGITVGAEVVAFNDTPIAQAIGAIVPPTGPFSNELSRRYDQQRYLLRAKVGDKARITFINPKQAEQNVTLKAIEERQSLKATSLYNGFDPTSLPVEYRVLESGLGYVRINSNDDDLDLIWELFSRAMSSFEYNDVSGVIVDLRQNSGGSLLGLAGMLSKKSIPLGQLEYFSEASRTFEPEGTVDEITAVDDPYDFEKLAVLVDLGCFSACELEAYGFSKLPGAIVVGQYPTAGVEAEVARGQFVLPEGIWLQIPTGRFVLPDKTLFLEGTGVIPTLQVPVNEDTVLSENDMVLQAAEEALLKQ